MPNEGQIINNIQELQDLEQELYLKLETSDDPTSRMDIVNKINLLSQSRISLYSQLAGIHSILKNSVSLESSNLKDRANFISLIERQLTKSKQQINKTKNLNINNLRLIEINTYYNKQYIAYKNILKIIVYLCLPLLILVIFKNRELLPSMIINGIGIVILTIGLLFIIPRIIDLYMRNNMDFDEYDSVFNSPQDSAEYNNKALDMIGNDHLKDVDNLSESKCLGPECCSSGMVYTNNKCQEA